MSLDADVYLGSEGLEPVATDSDGVVLPCSEKETGGGWYIVTVPDEGADFTVTVEGIAPVVCSARAPVDLSKLATDSALQQGLADNAAAIQGIVIPVPPTVDEIATAVWSAEDRTVTAGQIDNVANPVTTDIDLSQTESDLSIIKSRLSPAPELNIHIGVDEGGTIKTIRGNDYAEGEIPISYSRTNLEIVDSVVVYVKLPDDEVVLTKEVIVENAGLETQTIHIVLSSSETELLPADRSLSYRIDAVKPGATKTILKGEWISEHY